MDFIRSKKSLFLIFCCLVALLYFTLPREEKIPLPLVEGKIVAARIAQLNLDRKRAAALLGNVLVIQWADFIADRVADGSERSRTVRYRNWSEARQF